MLLPPCVVLLLCASCVLAFLCVCCKMSRVKHVTCMSHTVCVCVCPASLMPLYGHYHCVKVGFPILCESIMLLKCRAFVLNEQDGCPIFHLPPRKSVSLGSSHSCTRACVPPLCRIWWCPVLHSCTYVCPLSVCLLAARSIVQLIGG